MKKVLKKISKILLCIILSLLLLALIVLATLEIGLYCSHKQFNPYKPDYEKQDLSSILNSETLTQDDYNLLYMQTGLGKLGIDGFFEKYERKTAISKITAIQDRFMAGPQGYQIVPFVVGDTPVKYACKELQTISTPLAVLEEGDILVSSSTHFSMVRFGHAALVVSSEGNLLESFGYGDTSDCCGVATEFSKRQTFAILRVKKDKEFRKSVADYALKNLIGLDYNILAGVTSPKNPEDIKETNCGHIVWYAYNHFGIDLDSDGGSIVYPKDMFYSEHVEIVQIFGFDPVTLKW